MKKAARFGAPYRFEMVYFFTPTEASKNLIFFRPSVRRDNQGDVLTDRFARGVSKDPLSGGIPGRDDPIQGLANNNVIRRRNNRRQMRGNFWWCGWLDQGNGISVESIFILDQLGRTAPI